MDKTFFDIPDLLSMNYKPSMKENNTKKTTDANNNQVDLSDYIFPQIGRKDTPQIDLYYQYNLLNRSHYHQAEPTLAEKHIWIRKQLYNAPGVEELYLYSVRDAKGDLKRINNFYSLYPTTLKSEPALHIEGTLPISWEYDRLVSIGKPYHLVNSTHSATQFELARRLDSFASKAGNKVIRSDIDVIEMVYSTGDVILRKEYFSRRLGLVSTVTADYTIIKQGY